MKRIRLTLCMTILSAISFMGYAQDSNGDGYADHDVAKLQAFLTQTDGTQTNAAKLGWNADDPNTWNGSAWIDISGVKYLKQLDILYKSLIGRLDLSGCTNLTTLFCFNNQISTLNVSDLTNLTSLYCSNNQISVLDVSNLTKLTSLACLYSYFASKASITGLSNIESNLTDFFFDPQFSIALNSHSLGLTPGRDSLLSAITPSWTGVNSDITWSSDNIAIATVTADGLVTAVSVGTTKIYARSAVNPLIEDSCTVTVQVAPQIVGSESEPAGANRTGSLILALEMPSNVLFSGSFRLTLPGSMSIDVNATKLSDELDALTLTITQNSDASWLFRIESKVQPTLLNLVSGSYQDILKILYHVNESVPDGTYEVKISDINLVFNNGTTTIESEIPVQITVDHLYVGAEPVMSSPNIVTIITKLCCPLNLKAAQNTCPRCR